MTTATPTQLGMVGLGRMGANIVRRLMRDGHPAVYDLRRRGRFARFRGATGAERSRSSRGR
jgi:6-phosphogluconate dehydrogenase